MSWYAIEAIDEAIEDTKELLLPFNLGTWLRLALIVIFTGGGIGFVNPANFVPPDINEIDDTRSTVSDTSTASTTELENSVTGLATTHQSASNTVLVLVGLSLVGIITLFFYISSVFEFIYYQSLLDKNVSIRENFRKHWLNGLRYFTFEIAYLLIIFSLFLAVVGGFMINPGIGIIGLIGGIPVFILLAVLAGLVHDFVLPQMITTEKGLISSWRSIWPELRDQWREVVIYLVVKLGLGIAIGIGVTTLAAGVLIPFALAFLVVAFLLSMVSEVLILIPLIVGILLFGALMLGVTVATRTFVYFFIIEVYHSLTS